MVRTFSLYSVTGETRSAGCLGKSSGWFKHSEPQRTYSNHNITELARCGEVCLLRSGWFDCTKPSLTTAVQGKQGVQGAYALVRGGSSTANLIEPTRTTGITELARCVEVYHRSSGWFDCCGPSLCTVLPMDPHLSIENSLTEGFITLLLVDSPL